MKKLILFGVLALSINVFAQSTVKISNLEVMTEDLGYMGWEEAKKACKNLGDSWRLPSLYELNLLYKNKEKIGGFISTNPYKYKYKYKYWSSTDFGNVTYAWSQDFGNGRQSDLPISNQFKVRAVRAF